MPLLGSGGRQIIAEFTDPPGGEMDRNVWDPSSELTGSTSASNPASDPFAPAPPADPWAPATEPDDPWGAKAQGGGAQGGGAPGGGAQLGGAQGAGSWGSEGQGAGSWGSEGQGAGWQGVGLWGSEGQGAGSQGAGSWGRDARAAGPQGAGSWAADANGQPTVAWGDESPTVVWPWGVEPARQQPASWGSPPAPGAMDFPAAEPLTDAERRSAAALFGGGGASATELSPDAGTPSAANPSTADPFAAAGAPSAADPFAAAGAPSAADPFAAAGPRPAAGPFGAVGDPSAGPPFDFGPRYGAPDPFAPGVRSSPKAPGRRRLILVAGAVLVVMVGGGGAVLALRDNGSQPTPADTTVAQDAGGGQAGNGGDQPTLTPATSDESSPDTESTSTPSPTADPQAQATAELEQIYEGDRDSVSFDGQYVAQIASKYPGITDKLQTTANGSHRFLASDILAEFKELKSGHESPAHPVVLLKSTDYGKRQLKNGHFLWVTFALGDFPTSASVTSWCNSEFSDLSQEERVNQCAFRRLQPPQ
jgi:hypothetical protein